MFNLLLTDNPSNFFRSLFIIAPVIPFRLLLPGTIPEFIIPLYLTFPVFFGFMSDTETPAELELEYHLDGSTVSPWPPSPAWLGLMIVPILRPIYHQLFSRLRTRVLGSPLPRREKRYLSDRVKRMFSFRRPPAHENQAQAAQVLGDGDGDPAQVVIADDIVRQDQSSLMHDVLHAVLSVVVPPVFGNLLLRAATAGYLRRFLGLRAVESGAGALAPGLWAYHPNWAQMTPLQRAGANLGAVGGLLFGGSWMWADLDPVWSVSVLLFPLPISTPRRLRWRNSLGYGFFVLVNTLVLLCLSPAITDRMYRQRIASSCTASGCKRRK